MRTITVVEHKVLNTAGKPGIYGTVHFKNLAIGMVPIDAEGCTYLVGPYRYPPGRYSWEIPEGDGRHDVAPLAAQRELLEEVGLVAGGWQEILRMDLSNSVTDESGLCFLTWDLEQRTAEPEDTELLQIRRLPLREAVALTLSGGIVAPKGRAHVRELVAVLDKGESLLPELARQTLLLIAGMIDGLSTQIRKTEIELMAWHRVDPTCRRLETIPGIGFITATALVATVGDAETFRSGRQFAAWLGLVPKQHSSGGKERKGGISKSGDRHLRHLLVVGATAVVRSPGARPPLSAAGRTSFWSASLRVWSRSPSPTRWPDRLGGHGP